MIKIEWRSQADGMGLLLAEPARCGLDMFLGGESYETVRVRPVLDHRDETIAWNDRTILGWTWTSMTRKDLDIPAGTRGMVHLEMESAREGADAYMSGKLAAMA